MTDFTSWEFSRVKIILRREEESMIAIIGAMKVEIDALLALMEDVEASSIQKIPFYTGKLADVPVVVTQSGVGKTLAAMSTTLLLEHFEVSGLINIGTAGGLMDNQAVLDVVISTRIAHHDVDVPGWNHGFGLDNPCCFAADERCVQAVSQVIQEHDRAWIGPIASGDYFVNTAQQVARIKQEYPEALCAEMEAANRADCTLRRSVCRCAFAVRHYVKAGNEMTFEEYAQKAS
ncbi:MAG: 5'-methylthioadenosine/S-adenosylhomocysteine nucleosidase [Holdemania massiliensis]